MSWLALSPCGKFGAVRYLQNRREKRQIGKLTKAELPTPREVDWVCDLAFYFSSSFLPFLFPPLMILYVGFLVLVVGLKLSDADRICVTGGDEGSRLVKIVAMFVGLKRPCELPKSKRHFN